MRAAMLWLLLLAFPSSADAQQPRPQTPRLPSASLWQGTADVTSGLPVYPESATAQKHEATVEVELVVGTDGRVLHGRLSRSGGEVFDAATMSAIRGWRFSPFRDPTGRPIAILTLAKVTFGFASGGPAVSAQLMPVSNDPPAMTTPFPDGATLAELTVAKTPGVAWPAVVRQVTPSYTAETVRAKIQGEATLQVVVRADGTVEHVRVAKSLHPALDRQAQLAAAYWLFTPATRNGQPVSFLADLIISFNLH